MKVNTNNHVSTKNLRNKVSPGDTLFLEKNKRMILTHVLKNDK